MSVIDEVTRELLDKTEFLALVTEGPDGAHVVGNWGEYLRRLGLDGDRIVLPAGYYRRTEENLGRNDRIQIMVASRSVAGSHGPGQGCVLKGSARIESDGERAERAKAAFPWARGALVITVSSVETQL